MSIAYCIFVLPRMPKAQWLAVLLVCSQFPVVKGTSLRIKTKS